MNREKYNEYWVWLSPDPAIPQTAFGDSKEICLGFKEIEVASPLWLYHLKQAYSFLVPSPILAQRSPWQTILTSQYSICLHYKLGYFNDVTQWCLKACLEKVQPCHILTNFNCFLESKCKIPWLSQSCVFHCSKNNVMWKTMSISAASKEWTMFPLYHNCVSIYVFNLRKYSSKRKVLLKIKEDA